MTPGHGVAGGAAGDVLDRRLEAGRHADGVAVVLDHDDHRQLVDAREVQPLVEVALVARALAQLGDRDLVCAADLGGEGDAHRVQHLGRHGRALRHDVVDGRAVVAGHLAAAGAGVVGPGELGQHDLPRRHAEGHAGGHRAVVGHQPVVAPAQVEEEADLRALVALAADDEGHLAGAVQHPHALVEGARGGDEPIHLDELVAPQPQLRAEGQVHAVGGGPFRGRRSRPRRGHRRCSARS